MAGWLLTDAVVAQSSSSTTRATADSQNLDHGDRRFIEKAVKAGLKEVTVSQEALPGLTVPAIREFAEMMVRDHGAANSKLAELASRKGVVISNPGPKVDDKWTKHNKSIDKDYIKEMEDDHEEAVDLFEKAAKSKDAEIASFAQATLPTLQNHLSVAKSLKKSTK